MDFEVSQFNAGYKHPSSLSYVGSAAVGVARRLLSRTAIYKRLKKTDVVDAELSLISHNNLFNFVVVPRQSFSDSVWRGLLNMG